MESDIVKINIPLSEELLSEIPLPDELLSEIISQFIPLCQWSRYLEYVSKQFQRCVCIAYGRIKYILCERLFSLPYFPDDTRENCAAIRLNSILEKLSAVCPNLAAIDGFEFVTSNMPHCHSWHILGQFDNLQSISLEDIQNIVFRSFANLVANSKSLKDLSITSCTFDSAGTLDVGSLSHVNFQMETGAAKKICLANLSEKLIALTLNNFSETFENPNDGMKNCNNLESFSITLFTMDDYEIFLANLLYLRKLTKLSVIVSEYHPLQPSAFNMQFCEQLSFLKNQLKFINFKDVVMSEEVQCFLLTEFVKLRRLTFNRGCSVLSASAAKNVSRLSALGNLSYKDDDAQILPVLLQSLVKLTNFTAFTVIGNYLCDWKHFENICCLVNLQNLCLDGGFVSDDLLKTWDNKNPEMFEKLVSFRVLYAPFISDAGAILIAKKARNLKILFLGHTRISEKTISVLADVAKKLRKIYLSQREPLLFDENDIVGLIKKAISLEKVIVQEQLVDNIREHKSFVPFVEYVEIDVIPIW